VGNEKPNQWVGERKKVGMHCSMLFNHAVFSVTWYEKIVAFCELEGIVYEAVLGNFRTLLPRLTP
jgi:hypothetical protein